MGEGEGNLDFYGINWFERLGFDGRHRFMLLD